MPVENSTAGSINKSYDLLLDHDLKVHGEILLRVRHNLLVVPGKTGEIRQVRSHPQALAQCDGTLRRLGVKTEPVYDTAGSVRLVQAEGNPRRAAIASRRAAQLYGMSILAEAIEDNPLNFTRFLIVAAEPVHPRGDAKTSIVFALQNAPGAAVQSPQRVCPAGD